MSSHATHNVATTLEHHIRRIAEHAGAGWSAECSVEICTCIEDALDALDRRIDALAKELRQRTRGVEPDLR